MQRGFLYLVAIMDWSTRAVLSWRLSNTMYPDFCVEALQEALSRFGRPEIEPPRVLRSLRYVSPASSAGTS